MKEFGHDPSSWWRKPDPTTPEMRKHFANQGPQTWQPFAARNWELLGLNGKPLALARYKGKPFIVILYLGFGCIHCVEQLRDFHPHVEAYRKAGLEILAIGTDIVENMRAAMKDLPADERFAYTMLSDPKMRVFRDWVAYDSFGKMPMHGTYLVSGDGKILFQDISHEPFDHPEWFLKECKRLLAR